MASCSAGGTSPREAPSLTGSAASRSPRPSAGEGAALYSSVEFARALAALQRGSPLLKWSKRAQAPRARLFTLRVPVDAEPAAVAALTTRYTAALERLIRRHPEQYFWLHRRWKHQPSAKKMQKKAAA